MATLIVQILSKGPLKVITDEKNADSLRFELTEVFETESSEI